MSGIDVFPVTAVAVLSCDRCGERWESRVYTPQGYEREVEECAPAFARGWRVYMGQRNRRTYCPDCEPVAPMAMLVYPERRSLSKKDPRP